MSQIGRFTNEHAFLQITKVEGSPAKKIFCQGVPRTAPRNASPKQIDFFSLPRSSEIAARPSSPPHPPHCLRSRIWSVTMAQHFPPSVDIHTLSPPQKANELVVENGRKYELHHIKTEVWWFVFENFWCLHRKVNTESIVMPWLKLEWMVQCIVDPTSSRCWPRLPGWVGEWQITHHLLIFLELIVLTVFFFCTKQQRRTQEDGCMPEIVMFWIFFELIIWSKGGFRGLFVPLCLVVQFVGPSSGMFEADASNTEILRWHTVVLPPTCHQGPPTGQKGDDTQGPKKHNRLAGVQGQNWGGG